jgi:hypothetical protein
MQLSISTNGSTRLIAETASCPTTWPTIIESAVCANCEAAAVSTAAATKVLNALETIKEFLSVFLIIIKQIFVQRYIFYSKAARKSKKNPPLGEERGIRVIMRYVDYSAISKGITEKVSFS